MTELADVIKKCLKENGPLTAKGISEKTGLPFDSIRQALGHLSRRGEIQRGAITYNTPYGLVTIYSKPPSWRIKK